MFRCIIILNGHFHLIVSSRFKATSNTQADPDYTPTFFLGGWFIEGNNKVSGQLEIFFRWNPLGTFRNIPKKVPGAPSQGFLNFLVFVKNITKFDQG